MQPSFILFIIALYFLLLVIISFVTAKGADNKSFFIGAKKSPWFLVAFGMIGASLSGVTFISIPGWVGATQFAYMQTVLGYLLGYVVIATVLMPLYYRLNLTSIYTYLEQRFGFFSYKTGASFFLLSRTIGASFRMFLVANVLQFTIFDTMGIPFWFTVVATIFFIWLYTFKGGIKTIVWTDTLQTLFMLLAVVFTILLIGRQLNWELLEVFAQIKESEYSQIFFFTESHSPNYFWKHFLGGAFIAISMTGLDQDMMQKNLSCKNIKEAKKNMLWFSVVLVFVNLLFLCLGALLYLYCEKMQIALPEKSDNLYPMLAMGGYLGDVVGVIFILGLIAAAYSSADSALTALTTSFCIDILSIEKHFSENQQIKIRKRVHMGTSAVMFLCILLFHALSNDSVIKELFTIAGYTYGPLLGLYAYGLLTHFQVNDKWVPVVCILSPILCYVLNHYSETWFGGYKFGFELLILNGILTFVGLLVIRKR
ncbi:MAG: sodium:solute symporter [Flavobacteriales bacterium]|nr:sodium:solute symporter [Flavobacteriales bacterium]